MSYCDGDKDHWLFDLALLSIELDEFNFDFTYWTNHRISDNDGKVGIKYTEGNQR